MYSKLYRFTDRLTHILALLGFAGLLLLACMVALDVLLRFLFSYPLRGVNDVSAVIMAVVISACIPKCLMLKQNISIDILGNAAGPFATRILNVFSSLAVFIFFALMLSQFIPYAQAALAGGEKTWVLGWRVGPWWAATTVMIAAAVLAQAMVFLTDLIALISGETPDVASPADDTQSTL